MAKDIDQLVDPDRPTIPVMVNLPTSEPLVSPTGSVTIIDVPYTDRYFKTFNKNSETKRYIERLPACDEYINQQLSK